MYNIGDRVIAISHTEDNEIFVFGEGEYIGEEVPDDSVGGPVGKAMHECQISNPCIKLDNGEKVYGCECWWGPVEQVKNKFVGFGFVEIDINESRKHADIEEKDNAL